MCAPQLLANEAIPVHKSDSSRPPIAHSLASDIKQEFSEPARLTALRELLPQTTIDQMSEDLAIASADLDPIDRLIFESRTWEMVIRKLRARQQLGNDAKSGA